MARPFSLLLLATLCALAACTEPDAPPPTPSDPEEAVRPRSAVHFEALAVAVNEYLERTSAAPETVDRTTEFVPLDGDDQPDALVLFGGEEFVTESGYTLVVFHFRSGSQSYEPVSATSYARPPVLVTNERTNGWRDLVLGQFDPESETVSLARLAYDSGYPADPTSLPTLTEAEVGMLEGQAFFAE